jgi:transcriptional regulator with XRE-family HTH domain
MKKLPEWLWSIRTDRAVSLQDISNITGLATSQISRIEQGKSDLTLFSVAKICHALRLDLFDLQRALQWNKSLFDILILRPSIPPTDTVAIPSDIASIINLYKHDPIASKDFLHKSFNWVRFLAGFEKNIQETQANQFIKEAIEPLGDNYKPVPYPSTLSDGLVLETYMVKGALSIFDLGLLIRKRRKKKSLSLKQLSEKSNISFSALRRIEVGEIERIKFSDIFSIDTALGNEGDILAVAWDVAQLYTGISLVEDEFSSLQQWNVREKGLAETLIAISRWYQVFLSKKNWLKELRLE